MDDTLKLTAKSRARHLFTLNGGYLTAADAIDRGIHPRDLYSLRDDGTLEMLARGLYRLKDLPKLRSPDYFTIGVKVPNGILCLTTALEIHQLIQPNVRPITVSICKGTEKPKLPSIAPQFFFVSEPAFSAGVEAIEIDGIKLKIYSKEKTLADCFKFRNKIGLDLCLDALRNWWNTEEKDVEKLIEYSRICRVEKTVKPYLEMLQHIL